MARLCGYVAVRWCGRLGGCVAVWLGYCGTCGRVAVWWLYGCAVVWLWLCVGVVDGGAPWLRECCCGCGCDYVRGCVAACGDIITKYK